VALRNDAIFIKLFDILIDRPPPWQGIFAAQRSADSPRFFAGAGCGVAKRAGAPSCRAGARPNASAMPSMETTARRQHPHTAGVDGGMLQIEGAGLRHSG